MKFAKLFLFLVVSMIFIPAYPVLAYSKTSCQCVSFRLDDIQDYWLDNVQTKIIDTFHQKNASLTIGIIGNHIGQDFKLVHDVKTKVGKTNPALEIANHGWNHEDFTQFSREQQGAFMKNTNDKISKLFGVVPSVFIPPFDTINSDTMIAFLENNFRYVSADVSQDAPSTFTKNTQVYHVPGTGQISNLTGNDNVWRHYDNQHVLVKIMSDIHKYGYSMIIIHPPEYALRTQSHYTNDVDTNQIKNLGLLIDSIKKSGIKIVTMDQIPSNMQSKHYPSWLNTLFAWNEKGIISDKQVLSNVNYLIDKKIITSHTVFK